MTEGNVRAMLLVGKSGTYHLSVYCLDMPMMKHRQTDLTLILLSSPFLFSFTLSLHSFFALLLSLQKHVPYVKYLLALSLVALPLINSLTKWNYI